MSDQDAAIDRQELAIPPLPAQLTSFIGREREMAEVKQLLTASRLVTLTGAGGCGKTRLALRVASDVRDTYADGVCWVELAPLADPTLLPQAIAKALNTVEQPGRVLLNVILDLLHDKRLLLVLDNCEHLASACAEFAHDALCNAPQVSILATSREPLAVMGELLYPVSPLALPPKSQVTDIAPFDSIRLFVERARGVLPNFALTSANALPVADICRHLDGIPLAIELASARVNALTVEQIAARLDDRFTLLTSARHGVPSHHRTLRAALDWSYDSLSAEEQTLLQRLSVFAGGCTLEAVEQVCTGDGFATDDIVDRLSSLVSKSLVVAETREPGEARYRMLETIRQYAGDKLTESGEAERLHDRHLDFYLKFAEEAEPQLKSAGARALLDRIESELDDVRLALDWVSRGDRLEKGLRIISALNFFWYARRYLSETYMSLLGLLRKQGAGDRTFARAEALCTAGQLAEWLGHFEDSCAFYDESIGILREVGEAGRPMLELALAVYGSELVYYDLTAGRRCAEEAVQLCRASGNGFALAIALIVLGLAAHYSADLDTARTYYEEAGKTMLEIGDKPGYARMMSILGTSYLDQGDLETAKDRLEEGLAMANELGDRWNLSLAKSYLGEVARIRGQYDDAESWFTQVIVERRDWGEPKAVAWSFMLLARIEIVRGNYALAARHLSESFPLAREAGSRVTIPSVLESWAFLFAASRNPRRAARLFGAAQALREKQGTPQHPVEHTEYDQYLDAAHAQLDEASFRAAWDEGRAMTLEQAIAEVEQETITSPPALAPALPRDPNALTARELEVLRLVAAGLSDAQMAAKLVISRRTVSTHLTAIYGKLGVNSRSAAARCALDRKLI